MRNIVASGIEIEPADPGERVAETGELPLSLVDWRGDSAKFDRSWYLSSVMALRDVVADLHGVREFDPSEYDDARNAVENLAAVLDLGPQQGFDVPTLRQSIDTCEAEERPFALPREKVEIAAEGFKEKFGPRVTKPLVGLRPYKELINRYKEINLIGHPLEAWLSLDGPNREALLEEEGAENPEASVRAIVDELKTHPGTYALAYQVVFQKAFIRALHAFLENKADVLSYWRGEADEEDDAFIDSWIGRFNETLSECLRPEGVDSPFYGAGIKFEGTTDFRKSRIDAIAAFIVYVLLAPLGEWKTEHDSGGDPTSTIEEWLSEVWSDIRAERRPTGIAGFFTRQGRKWRQNLAEMIEARAAADGIDLDEDDLEQLMLEHGARQLLRVVVRQT
jgi:hypothetical protein